MKRKARESRGFDEVIGFASWLTSEGRSLVHRFKREARLNHVPERMLCGRERGAVAVREHLCVPKDETPCDRCLALAKAIG